jgi:hypothetical protein
MAARLVPVTPFGPLDSKEEDQNEEERLAIARRFRAEKTERLAALVRPVIDGDPVEVGEFSTRPLEAMAAVPLVGAFLALGSRVAGSRKKLSAEVLVALDTSRVHLLSSREEVTGPKVELIWSRPREEVRVSSVTPKFMREEVVLEIRDEDPLKLYATSLRSNPWAAGIVRALGGEAPEPRDLGSDGPPGSA